MKWKDRNFGTHPSDPEYETDYDKGEDYEDYLDEQELKEQSKRENDG